MSSAAAKNGRNRSREYDAPPCERLTSLSIQKQTRLEFPVKDIPVAAPPVWFAAGADDLSRLSMEAESFEDTYYGLSSGEWPKGRPEKKKTGRRSSGDPFFIERAQRENRETDEILHEIRSDGFVWIAGNDPDGHWIPGFREIGRRTAIPAAHVLRRVAALVERRPVSGNSKGVADRLLRKEAALLEEYVTRNSRVAGIIRVDNDMTFSSWAHVSSWLQYLLDEGEIPCKPHLGIAKRTYGSQIIKPHFLILLAPGDEVRMDRRCKRGPRGLLRAAEIGWTRALRGDPGGLSNPTKFKNPLSPMMTVGIFNQQHFPALSEMVETLDCRRFDERKIAAEAADLDQRQSNQIFDDTRHAGWKLVPKMANLGDPRYPQWVADRTLFAEECFGILAPPAVARYSGDKTTKQIEAIVRIVCANLAKKWNPDRVSQPPDRGAMQLRAEMPIKEKRDASGKWSSAKRMCQTIDAMAEEITRIEATGRTARQIDLIDSGIWSESTVKRRFDAAFLLSWARCQPVSGKKDTPHPVKLRAVRSGTMLATIVSSSIISEQPFVACCPINEDHQTMTTESHKVGKSNDLSDFLSLASVTKRDEALRAKAKSVSVDKPCVAAVLKDASIGQPNMVSLLGGPPSRSVLAIKGSVISEQKVGQSISISALRELVQHTRNRNVQAI